MNKNYILLFMLLMSTTQGFPQIFTCYTESDGLASDKAYIAVDNNGKVVSLMTGVTKATAISIIDGTTISSLSFDSVGLSGFGQNVVVDNNNNYYISITGSVGGVIKYDGSKFSKITTDDGLISNIVTWVDVDTAGNLWVSTGSGLSKYNGVSCTNFTTSDGLKETYLNRVMCEDDGRVYVFYTVSGNNGCTSLDLNGKNAQHYNMPDIPSSTIQSAAVDTANDVLWLGSLYVGGGDGVTEVKNDGSYNQYTKLSGDLNGDGIRMVEFDNFEGKLYVCAQGGLNIYDYNTWINFDNTHGLSGTNLSSVGWDHSTNKVWIGSSSGVCYANSQDLVSVRDLKKHGISVYNADATLHIISDHVIRDLLVFDNSGRLLLKESEPGSALKHNLSSGVYYFQFSKDGIIYSGKVVVE